MSQAPYHLAATGQSLRVLSYSEVESGLATGRLDPATWSWCETEVQWQALSRRPEFAHAVQAARMMAPPAPLAWEDAGASRSYLKRYFRTLKEVLFRPQKTFREFKPEVTPWAAVRWFGLSAMLSLLVGFGLYSPLIYWVRQSLAQKFGTVLFADSGPMVNLSYLLRAIFGGSLVLGLWLLVGASVLQVILKILQAGQKGWGVTLRTLAYVLGAYLWVALLPCGSLFVPILLVIAATRALAFAHAEPEWKPLIAVLVFAGITLISTLAWLFYSAAKFFSNF